MAQPLNLQQRLLSAYILVTGDIMVASGDADTYGPFKCCALFRGSATHINSKHIDIIDNIDIKMPMYNLIEYSDNYSDTPGI